MNPPPHGWPRIAPAVFYDDPATAIDWLCAAFGFEVRLKVEGEGGSIEHCELVYDGGMIMIGQAAGTPNSRRPHARSPRSVSGANTQALCVCVDNVDAHCATAKAAGAIIVSEATTTDYGDDYWADRTYEAEDLEGHRWWFLQRVREASGAGTTDS